MLPVALPGFLQVEVVDMFIVYDEVDHCSLERIVHYEEDKEDREAS